MKQIKSKRGRKPRKTKRVAITVRVEPGVFADWQELRHNEGLSGSNFLDLLISEHKVLINE
jgi:hypothetical protein